MTTDRVRPFADRLGPALLGKGFRQDDYWVWCGSVARGEDRRWHMFASRWPKRYPFFQGYLAASEVVRASADTPEGPYTFEEVVLPARGAQWWDGRMTHNPFIVKLPQGYALFYIGATYPGETPSAQTLHRMAAAPGRLGEVCRWYNTIRIGVALAPSVTGPWTRPQQPTFDIDPDGWDSTVVTNPSPAVAPDGRIYLYYRSAGAKLGLAVAEQPEGPYLRQGEGPVVDPGEDLRIEDPFVWWSGDHWEMLCKDLTGRLTGEFHAGVHLLSPDGVDWSPAPRPKAWSRTLRWDDGTTTTQGNFERPFLLMNRGEPTHLFAATADGPGGDPEQSIPGFTRAHNTWTMVVKLT